MDHDFGSLMDSFKQYFSKYDSFVKLNPRVAAEVEAIVRWSSYLVATKRSPIFGELLSSGANLLQLCNDIILRQANPELKLNLQDCATQLKTLLSVIQSLELLAEIYARDTYGSTGRWVIITVIQITKAAIKLILLLVFDQGISKSQLIVPLDRIHYTEIVKLQEKFADEPLITEITDITAEASTSKASKSIVLKSTGRKMRSITESPPKSSRFGQSKTNNSDTLTNLQKQKLIILLNRYRELKSSQLTERQLYGELIHIARPIAHLALMGGFGTKSWISYFTSLMMDISSLYLVRSPMPLSRTAQNLESLEQYSFNINERIELGQRASSLLLYLLRSPFFDDYTKQKALDGIASTAENIPLIGNFLATFVGYIPEWQQAYFRIWSE